MVDVLRAAAPTRPPPPSRRTTASKPPPPSRPGATAAALKPPTKAVRLPEKPRSTVSLLSPIPTSLSLLALFSSIDSLHEAQAVAITKEDLVSSLTKVEETIDQVGDVGSKAVDFSFTFVKTLSEILKPAIDASLPALQSASQEALKLASPVVSDASNQAKDALQTAGVDASPVLSAAKILVEATQKAAELAKPIAASTVETITSSDPSVILFSAGGLFLAYLLYPPVWSLVSFNLRGYKGNLSPAQALDMVSTQNYILVDIRSEKDKNKTGVPQLPSASKNRLISVPLEELPNKIKSLVRSTKQVEAEIVALKISYLKRVNKGSNIIIMDSYSDIAKIVGKTLTTLGFNNCYIMTDGFSGRKGWIQSKLGFDSYNLSLIEVLSPSRVIPARFGTTSSGSQRKLLPGD
ncbi:hypothetical protein LUZ60_000166 [Juncus effusus]|nr:hypothetical protein LUZ60_000166 [Juncus effusus]